MLDLPTYINTLLDNIIAELDCGDNSCRFKKSGGMRTNGGCRCERFFDYNEHDHMKSRNLQNYTIRLVAALDRARKGSK